MQCNQRHSMLDRVGRLADSTGISLLFVSGRRDDLPETRNMKVMGIFEDLNSHHTDEQWKPRLGALGLLLEVHVPIPAMRKYCCSRPCN